MDWLAKQARAKKLTEAARAQHNNDHKSISDEVHNEPNSKGSREARHDHVISASGLSQNILFVERDDRNTNGDAVVREATNSAFVNGISSNNLPAAFLRDGNIQDIVQRSQGFPETVSVLNTDNLGTINEVVLQLLLHEQQRAKRQVVEQLLHLPNNPSIHQQQVSQSTAQASVESSQANEVFRAHLMLGQHATSTLDSTQQMQGAGQLHEDALRHLMHQQQLLSLERAIQTGNRQWPQLPDTQQPQDQHALWLVPQAASVILPPSAGRSINTNVDRFDCFQQSEYNKEQLRKFQALSSMPPPRQVIHSPALSAQANAMQPIVADGRLSGAKGLESGVAMAEATVPTSYDFVPATPHNEELAKRARYLVQLSHADMSTWRKSRRRFFDHGDVEDNDGSGDSKPPSRKKKARK